MKKDIFKENSRSDKWSLKEEKIYGKNCDIGISNGSIILISRINKGKIYDTGINAEDFFDLLFLMLVEVDIYNNKTKQKLSWDELKSIIKKDERVKKIKMIFDESDEQEPLTNDKTINIEFGKDNYD